MPTVRAGCTQRLAATDPFSVAANDVMVLVRIAHNRLTYEFRQESFRRDHWWQGLRGSVSERQAQMPPFLTHAQLKGLLRGSHTRTPLGEIREDADPRSTRAILGMLGQVWDRIFYDFCAQMRGYYALCKAWNAAGRVGTRPGLPGYHRAEGRAITYRANMLHLVEGGTLLRFTKGKSPAAVNLPDLAVPA